MATVTYPSDFAPVDPAPFNPADPTLFLGLDPLLVLLLAVVAILLAGGGGWVGSGMVHRRYAQDDPAEDIHRVLLRVLEQAMKASSNELPARAQAVAETFERVLGPALALGAGVNAPLKALKRALAGEAPHVREEGREDGAEHAHAALDVPSEPHGHGEAIAAANPAVVVVNQYVAPAREDACPPHGPRHSDHSHGSGSHPPRHDPGLSVPARAEQLRAAITALYDHWSIRADRIADLRAARRALSRRPSGPGDGH